ncbi:MAG: hypothetical protein ACFE8N_05155 [Promethearchaeota archaeon]
MKFDILNEDEVWFIERICGFDFIAYLFDHRTFTHKNLESYLDKIIKGIKIQSFI